MYAWAPEDIQTETAACVELSMHSHSSRLRDCLEGTVAAIGDFFEWPLSSTASEIRVLLLIGRLASYSVEAIETPLPFAGVGTIRVH